MRPYGEAVVVLLGFIFLRVSHAPGWQFIALWLGWMLLSVSREMREKRQREREDAQFVERRGDSSDARAGH